MALLNELPKDYYAKGGDGEYQSVKLENIIKHFMVAYVGEDKIIPKVKRLDVAFHAQRAAQELSYDTFAKGKSQEITVPPSLKMILPQDYVNYTKISRIDSSGIKHLLYPTSKTSNPIHFRQDDEGKFFIQPVCTMVIATNTVTLDGDYSDTLIHGMRVEPIGGWTTAVTPSIPNAAYIHDISTTAGITQITLENKNGSAPKNALISRTERLNITRFNIFGQTMRLDNQSLTETTATVAMVAGDNAITVASTTDIKPGMFINHNAFIGGTTVLSVGTSTIIASTTVLPGHAVAVPDPIGFMTDNNDSTTWNNYKSATSSENQNNYIDDTYWPMDGSRFGLDPQHAQANGSFYFSGGNIHFSSNMSGKNIVLDYISDSMGSPGEMKVHKFAEEAVYKWISHAILASKANTPEYLVARYKKERFAAIRTAKLRLSNIKLEEFTQILRGKSKQIKH